MNRRLDLPLFWRTFGYLVGLLTVVVSGWIQALDGYRLASQSGSASGWAWVLAAVVFTLGATAWVADRINRPMRALSFAASRIGEGEFDSRLDENIYTHEIRQVNMGFNRMARELAKVEEERAIMLAGISHDLRTPLARLRLEAEMSVSDEEARNNMASDIDQLDAIIDKFMDYARPGEVLLKPVPLLALVDREAAAFRKPEQIRIAVGIAQDVKVMADETELGRVLQNLFENARRYGRSADSGVARVSVMATPSAEWISLVVRDFGSGVPPDKVEQLSTPFYRGDFARTAATGAGLGLAIVEKAVYRMGGHLDIRNADEGSGLMVTVTLQSASSTTS